MSAELTAAVAALREAAAELTGASARLGGYDPGARGFGADGPGGLGQLGRDLHRFWSAGLDARAREAAAHGARLDDLAGTLALAGSGYATTEDAVRQRQPEA
jgi:hypothetical protein